MATLLSPCTPRPAAGQVGPMPADSATAMLRRGLAAALQAEGRDAVAFLRPIPAAALDDRLRAVRACMLSRLGDRVFPPVTVIDPFVRTVLATYQGYWMRSVRQEAPQAALDDQLRDSLNAQLSANGAPGGSDLDAIEATLQPLLESRGFRALLGVTSPLRELMLWRSERVQQFDVALPQGVQPVTVVFLDDFASLGWAGFVTCDRNHTGGWTKPDRLYAVASAYDTTSEAFRVSYLAHEGQHFWDTSHLPATTPQDVLEYRAKLVELAVGRTTVYDLLSQFEVNAGEDPAVPHAYANGRVIRGLRARLFPQANGTPSWRTTSVEAVNAAATALLQEEIARSPSAGPLHPARQQARDPAELERALAAYDSTFRTQDPAAIAAWFLPNGEMGSVGHPSVVGPDSIAATLRRFAAFHLIASRLSPATISNTSDSGRIEGHYWQRVRLPAGDTVEAQGTFTMIWAWVPSVGWRLRRLVTDP